MTDEYADSGEFLDILSRDARAVLREPVAAALRGVAPASGPLIDLGAGSGRGVRVLAGLAPDAAVWAVELSAVQRAALFARLMDDDALSGRVTVIAATAEQVELPERLGGVLALNMIDHLTPAERRRLWRRVADRLAPGAPLVVNLQPPARPEVVPERDFAVVSMAGRRYVGSGRAEPDGPEAVVWHIRYRVCDEQGGVEREVAAAYRWHMSHPTSWSPSSLRWDGPSSTARMAWSAPYAEAVGEPGAGGGLSAVHRRRALRPSGARDLRPGRGHRHGPPRRRSAAR